LSDLFIELENCYQKILQIVNVQKCAVSGFKLFLVKTVNGS